ncbi:uncharacterized protein LOC129919872 isoform X1 [Episyrphus balteatus]|uniref:uncharacterized protein LOC129919872 isoform X1 n=1 Tax=Episyrphus balteatus TaxID=286459 RepID=UPI00248652FF|nr:uncharacterized protein LOC129919872 isoform X1 [Episyrphus balteatus]
MIVLSDSKIEQKKKTSITYVVTINGNKLHIQRVHAWGGKSLWKISLIYCAAGSVKAYNRRAAAAMTNKRRAIIFVFIILLTMGAHFRLPNANNNASRGVSAEGVLNCKKRNYTNNIKSNRSTSNPFLFDSFEYCLVLFLKNCIKSITRTNPHNSCQITLQKTNRLKLKGYT